MLVTATDASNNSSHSVGFNYSVVDYSVTLAPPSPTAPGGSTAVSVTVAGLNNFAGAVAATCNAQSPLTCTLNPAGPYTLNTTTTTVTATATVTAPANAGASSYSVTINTSDTQFSSLAHNPAVDIAVQDFQIAGTPATETVTAGGASTPHTITITGLGGFSGTVTLTCASGLPQLATCAFSATTITGGGSSTLTIHTKAPTVSQARPPARPRGTPLYAFWLTLPGMVVGLFGFTARPESRGGKLVRYLGTALFLALLLALSACGGGGGGTTSPPPIPVPGTPAGTYTIMVQGTSTVGSAQLNRTVPITLTVQ